MSYITIQKPNGTVEYVTEDAVRELRAQVATLTREQDEARARAEKTESVRVRLEAILGEIGRVLGEGDAPEFADRIRAMKRKTVTLAAELEKAQAERDALSARVQELEGALRDALTLIGEARSKNPHSPWCNGVHVWTCCEGDLRAFAFIDRIRVALSPDSSPAAPEGADRALAQMIELQHTADERPEPTPPTKQCGARGNLGWICMLEAGHSGPHFDPIEGRWTFKPFGRMDP